MKIHEYQAKELMGAYGIPIPGGTVAETAEEAREIAKTLGRSVIKAQIHSGGRGKGGGVKVAETPDEAYEITKNMLGMNLVTHQCPDGRIVRKVLVTDVCNTKKEYYLAVTVDNEHAGLVIVASAEGGTEIEDTAKNHPELIIREPVSIYEGFHGYQGLEVARRLGLPQELRKDCQKIIAGMVKLCIEKDCSLVEINPLVETEDGRLLALDAKVNFDDNALFRHPDVLALRDINEEDPKEARAKEYDLNYVSLDGNIGCLVNGAGLAMATMDIIRKFGAKPANFLDVGGSATTERVTKAFELLLSDSRVQAIMVNIFGGIMKCDVIAQGIVEAAKTTGLSIPLIVRLEGTNVDLGKKILDESGLAIIPAADMADAARKAVAAANEGGVR